MINSETSELNYTNKQQEKNRKVTKMIDHIKHFCFAKLTIHENCKNHHRKDANQAQQTIEKLTIFLKIY